MNRKTSVTAAVLAVTAALSGCAPSQMSSFSSGLGFNSDQQQQAAQVTPGRVVSVSPVGSVGGGFLSGTHPGEDIVVRTFTQPAQMLSVIQPLKSGAPAFTAGEAVGVTTRNGNTRVIPLPGYMPMGSSKAGTVYWHTPPRTGVHMSLKSPFGN